MGRSERAPLVGKSGPSRGLSATWAGPRAEEQDEEGVASGDRSTADSALLGDFGLIARFGREQQVKMVERMQHSHGNAVVARAIAHLEGGTASVGVLGAGGAVQRAPVVPFRPLTSASPRILILNEGETKDVKVSVTNAGDLPQGHKLHWWGGVKEGNPNINVADVGKADPPFGAEAKLPITGNHAGAAHVATQVTEVDAQGNTLKETDGVEISVNIKGSADKR